MVGGMNKPDRIALRLESGIRPALEELAQEDHRTLSSLISKVLFDFVQERRPLPAAETPQ